MLKFLQKILHDPVRRNIIINTIGNYLNVVFVALFALILTRIMPPSEYGVLGVLLGISYVLANVLDFGTTATIYSYVPTMYGIDPKGMYRFIKSTFFYQSLFSVIVIAVLFLVFPFLDKVFFKTGVDPFVLHLTSFSVLLYIWQNFCTNILFAAKKFMRANIYINISNLAKTIVILVLAYMGKATVGVIIFVFGIIGPLSFFVLLLLLNRKVITHFMAAEIKKEEFRFGYTLTYFLASQFYNLGLRMDLFLLAYFDFLISKDLLGYYTLAQKIILTVITSTVSITQVISPRFAMIENKKDAKAQMKVAFYYMLIPTAIFIALYFTPKFVFELVFTGKYGATEAITKALSIPFILSALGSVPMLFLLYTVKKPFHILTSNILFFVILTWGSYILIPTKGVFGPPIAIAVAFVVATAIQSWAAYAEYKNLPN
jgi:O-antigen/teichoic acid export membrane protein